MYDIKLISIEKIGKRTNLSVSITNNTQETWNSGISGINLATWWGSSQDKKTAKRHFIFNEFRPGETKNYDFYINDPIYKYPNDQIQIDLVFEDNYWFRDKYNEIELNSELTKLGEQIQVTRKVHRNSSKKSLLVETRNLQHLPFIIKNTVQKLGDDWGHIIYCHQNNINQIKMISNQISVDIDIRILDFEIDRNSYNNLLLDINFWNQINCEKVFIYQTDTFIVKDFDQSFLQWDYLGANWGPSNHSQMVKKLLNIDFEPLFGNGGLSLRSKWLIDKSLRDVKFTDRYLSLFYKEFKLEKIPEDLFFSLYCYLNGDYKQDNSDFSIELIDGFINKIDLNRLPFGFHKIDRFNQWKEVLNIYINQLNT
jgi:hypothetical protein